MPEGWSRVRLGDIVAEFLNGGTPGTDEPGYWSGSIPWITGADIVANQVQPPRRFVSHQGVAHSATHVVPAGALLVVTRTGVGKVALAPYDLAISQDLTGAITHANLATSEYLFYWLTIQATALNRLTQGSSINGLVRDDLAKLSVLLPPLPEQRAIASVLDSIGEAITKTEAVIAATKQLQAALLQDLLTRGVPGRHTEWKRVPGIGTIPACWHVVRLGEVATV